MPGPNSSVLKRILPQLVILGVVLLLNFIVFPDFFRIEFKNGRLFGSLIDVLNRGAPTALLCVGMTLVIATKGIDLSVGAVMAIAGATAASLVVEGHGWFTALLGALAVGGLCGLWNGVLVAVIRIQPIVATLVLMVAGRGIAQLITEGTILTFNNEGLVRLGAGTVAGIPTPIVIWVALGALATFVIRRTALGLLIEAIGVNETSSRLTGINSRVILICVYVMSGLCAALAGVIVAADIKGADANNAGLWLELDAILAVVIGGNSLLGGRFSIVASLLGALIIQSVNSVILLSGMPPEFNLVIKALLILAILVIQSPKIGHLVYMFRAASGGRNIASPTRPAASPLVPNKDK
ncbi:MULTISPECIES: ABC transporter permease [Halocynthiibacter]|uniref:ABC transporter permease n=1 Tax=Halocynthiibacter halioticoli TaxID=2986804 RepID=A0AAE3J2D7_9RHOB|nr:MULTISPECIES: ABC transporter permease [Halocynthiibacter]MCV6823967.1 ABC transporter permease [Halocynthiibacter halioticoli]MCW4056968.1 ABC transporter permease [Halocynthiibacter sp. SDUM655004]MDE0590006.1 ABC transporter permease [Halocynthiibacter sp. C4]